MPNTPVRAAAEGMPILNRRATLAFLSGGIVAAAVVAPGGVAHPSPIAATLQDALSACQSAEDTLAACEARESAIAEALGEDCLFPKWSPPGGLASIWSHHPKPFRSSSDLEAEIARKSERVEESFAGGLMNRTAYERWTRALANEGGEGLATLQGQEARKAASGYPEAYGQTDEAYSAFVASFDTVVRHPCRTIEDVTTKAGCLIRGYKRLGMPVDSDDLIACLASFCGEG